MDVDVSEINKNKIVDVPIQGDARLTLKEFNAHAKNLAIETWVAQVTEWKHEFAHRYPPLRDTIVPQDVIVKLARQAPRDAIISVGVGQHQMWVAQFYGFHAPHTDMSCR